MSETPQDTARALSGEPPLRRVGDRVELTRSGHEAVARSLVASGAVVSVVDVAAALRWHRRTVLSAVRDGSLVPSGRTAGTSRLYFDLPTAAEFVAGHAVGFAQ